MNLLRDAPAIVLVIAAALPGSCTRPTLPSATLQAINGECQALLRANTSRANVSVPQSRWPPAVAGLKPEFVSVNPDGVDITARAFFDGGWGYYIPRSGRATDLSPQRYAALGAGVYWYGPD